GTLRAVPSLTRGRLLPFAGTEAEPCLALSTTVTGPLCYYKQSGLGWDWFDQTNCWACWVAIKDACRRFDEGVAAGVYDLRGYTKAERAARDRRKDHDR